MNGSRIVGRRKGSQGWPKSDLYAEDGRPLFKRDRLPGAHEFQVSDRLYAVATGEYRAPNAGEFFVSGALPFAYLAGNDLDSEHYIAKPVEVEKVTVYRIKGG